MMRNQLNGPNAKELAEKNQSLKEERRKLIFQNINLYNRLAACEAETKALHEERELLRAKVEAFESNAKKGFSKNLRRLFDAL